MRKPDRQRGAVAVEFVLSVPALLLIIFAGLALGRAVGARSRVVDAASFAARAEAIAAGGRPGGNVLPEQITAMVAQRMEGAGECTSFETQHDVGFTSPYRYLTVKVTCTLSTSVFGSLGLTTVSATAAMPIDFEPQ